MKKTNARAISYKQYRLTDIFLFVAIMLVAEMCAYFATTLFPSEALYTFSFVVPIALIVMVRWGWQCVFITVGSGLLYCLINDASLALYITYIIGNTCVMLMLIPLKIFGTEKITKRWFTSLLFVVGGWLCVYLGRSVVWAICYAISPQEGYTALTGFVQFAAWDLLSLAMAVVIVLVVRRFDGMFEDQMTYLKRVDKARREKVKADNFLMNDANVDEETLHILDGDIDQ
jgi:hypothetical protein